MNRKVVIWISVLFFIFIGVLGAEEARSDKEKDKDKSAKAQDYNNKALILIKEDRANEAIDLLENAVNLDPANKEVRKNLAVAYSWAGRQKEAIDTLKRLVKESPDYSEGHRHLVLIYNMEGRYREAIEHGEIALKLNPDDYSVEGYMAHNYFAVGDHRKAIESARRLAEHDPDNFRPYRILAMAHAVLEELKEAKEAFERSYGMDRSDKNFKETKEEARAMKAMFNEMRAEAFFMEGNRYIENAEQLKSIEAYEMSIKINPKDYRPHYNLAMIYDRMKEEVLALDSLENAAELKTGIIKQVMESKDFSFIKEKKAFQRFLKIYGDK
ncbi:MAG: tetratricopeptide repeat protein [Candidatus Omnitrophota bacterium]